MTRYQLIMGPNGPLDINHLAVHAAMELYAVKNRNDCFDKVVRLAHWWIEKLVAEHGGNG